MAELSRENLAKSHVLATFKGITERPCMVMIHPPPPPQRFANFEIHEYIEYEKPGQYGDEQSQSHGVELGKGQSDEVIAAIESLQPGELVELAWQHDYVTWSEDGGQTMSKYPERPVYILDRAPTLLLTVTQGEQGQDGSVPITLINMAGEEAANFAFDGVPLLADVRSAASEALQLHPLQLDFVDVHGAFLEDDGAALFSTAPGPEGGSAVPADVPQSMESQSTFSGPQPRACPMAAFATAPSAFSTTPQPQACPVAMAATSVAPQPFACPTVMATSISSISGMTAQPQPMTMPQPQMRHTSITAPGPSIVAAQSQAMITPSLSYASPQPQAYNMTMPAQILSACGSTFGVIPQQRAYQMATTSASSAALQPFAPQQACPMATVMAAAPGSFLVPQPCAPQQAGPAPTPCSYGVPTQPQPFQMPVVVQAPSTNGMIPIYAAPQMSTIYAAPQR